ncbi:SID1 transmembrane family member 1-like isoform X2 [Oratosquilla oratoria]|uniref:SID1 transmembrane family member 1-like isoform X2 n=1 Tax=Oratosquilla oratoria TaxID=337810 RepID=UPI003F762991
MTCNFFGFLVFLGIVCLCRPGHGKEEEVVSCEELRDVERCYWKGQKKIAINSSSSCDFDCWYNPSEKSPIRLGVHNLEGSLPAFVTMRQRDYAQSWTLPVIGPYKNQFYGSIEVMACPTIEYKNETLHISIATSVEHNIFLNLRIRNQSFDFSDARMEFNISVSPVSAWYQLYQWKDGVDTILVTVEPNVKDDEPICSLLSLQDAKCPAKTMPDDARSQGKYQTFRESAAMVANKENFKNGVFVVVIPLMDDSLCLGMKTSNITQRTKQVRVKIETQQSIGSVWHIYVFTGIGLSLFLVIATFVIKRMLDKSLTLEKEDEGDEPLLGGDDDNIFGGTGPNDMESSIGSRGSGAQSPAQVVQTTMGIGVLQTGPSPNMHVDSMETPHEGNVFNNVDSEDENPIHREKHTQPAIASAPPAGSNLVLGPGSSIYPTLPKMFDEDSGQMVPRTMFAPASTHAPPQRTLKIDNTYNPRFTWWWKTVHVWEGMTANSSVSDVGFQHNLLIIAVFTALPMIQLVMHTLQMRSLSGNEDFCYYNAKCMVQAGIFPDFSRVFTNLGYLVAGAAMFYITRHHKILTERIWKKNIIKTLPKDRTLDMSGGFINHDVGVSRHYGLFKSLGHGLIVQGIMSSLYHFCPNNVTIRFDMMFMFLMTVVMVVGVWGLRHTDVTRHVYPTVGIVAIALALSQCREWVRPWLFWMLMDTLHLGLMISTGVQLSLLDTWSFSPHVMVQTFRGYFPLMKKMKEKLSSLDNESTFKVLRGIRLGTAATANIAIAIYGPIAEPDDVYTYILVICLTNMGLYVLNYIGTKKIIFKERGTKLAWMSLSFASVLWPIALCFFGFHTVDTVKTCSSQATPSVSRIYNSHCILWGVFDSHDIWHVTSALALFFTFVGMLTLDDDLAYSSSQKIPVF